MGSFILFKVFDKGLKIARHFAALTRIRLMPQFLTSKEKLNALEVGQGITQYQKQLYLASEVDLSRNHRQKGHKVESYYGPL